MVSESFVIRLIVQETHSNSHIDPYLDAPCMYIRCMLGYACSRAATALKSVAVFRLQTVRREMTFGFDDSDLYAEINDDGTYDIDAAIHQAAGNDYEVPTLTAAKLSMICTNSAQA